MFHVFSLFFVLLGCLMLAVGQSTQSANRSLDDVEELVKPLRVQVDVRDDNISRLYRADYIYAATQLQIIWYQDGRLKKEESKAKRLELTNGTTNFITNSSQIKLEFVTGTFISTLIFRQDLEPGIVHEIGEFTLELMPSRALKYNYGSAAPGKIRLPLEDPEGFEREIIWSIYTAYYFINPPTIREYYQWRMKRSKNPPLRFIDSQIVGNFTEQLYILSSHNQDLEGLVTWSVTLSNINSTSPLDYRLFQKTIPVYEAPYDQPFPETLLGFIKKEHTLLTECPGHSDCEIICEVVGFEPIDVFLYKVDNGTKEPTNFIQTKRRQRHHLRQHFYIENMTKSLEGKYICQALNSAGFTRELAFQLFAKQKVAIIHSESSFVQIMNTEKNGFMIRCSASGHPKPTLSFRENNLRSRMIKNNTEYEIIQRESENGIQHIVLTIHDLRYDVFAYVCVAKNRFDSDSIYFYP